MQLVERDKHQGPRFAGSWWRFQQKVLAGTGSIGPRLHLSHPEGIDRSAGTRGGIMNVNEVWHEWEDWWLLVFFRRHLLIEREEKFQALFVTREGFVAVTLFYG